MTIASPDTDQACAPTASLRGGVSSDQANAAEQTPQVENGTARPARPHWDFWIVVGATLILAAVYVLYERFGTCANADQVVSFESLGDDAVVIGLTDEQPGFVLLSHLPVSKVDVDAEVQSNRITGKHTLLNIQTATSRARLRLRSPEAVLVQRDGAIAATAIPWTREDFDALLHAADCDTDCDRHKHRCGQPLADVAQTLAQWPQERVPPLVREFLANREERSPRPGLGR